MKNHTVVIIVAAILVSATTPALAIQSAIPSTLPALSRCDPGSDAIGFCVWDPSYLINPGIITFNTASPVNITGLLPWEPGEFGFCSGATYDLDNNLYMADYSSTSAHFYSINTDTWQATIVGDTNITIYALSCDPTTDTIYALGNPDSAAIYTIDPGTGQSTLIGSINGLVGLQGLAFDGEGTMYVTNGGFLYSVNKTTLSTTTIGQTGQPPYYTQDMCFDRMTNTLFVSAANQGSSENALFSCNRTTGLMTLIGDFQGLMEVDALAFKLVEPQGPTTSITLDGTQVNGTYFTPVTATLTVIPGDAPVAATYYQLDAQEWQTYTVAFTIADEGNHIIQYYSVDTNGLVEPTKNASFTILYTIAVTIKGGMGIRVTITNTGPVGMNVSYDVGLTGIVFPHQGAAGEVFIHPGASVNIRIMVFGFGPLQVKATANEERKTASGIVLLFLVLGF